VRRRALITLLGGVAVAWPVMAQAQQPAMPVVGLLSARRLRRTPTAYTHFARALKDIGYVEGDRISLAENQIDKLPALAAELIHQRVAVVFAIASSAALAAKATRLFLSSFSPAAIPSNLASSPVLIGRAGTSRERARLATRWRQSSWNCCTTWCLKPMFLIFS
jgi:putative ABC transport system substrate-binding protein